MARRRTPVAGKIWLPLRPLSWRAGYGVPRKKCLSTGRTGPGELPHDGHVVVPLLVAVEIAFAPPLWLQYAIWLPVIVIGALLLIQPAKGAVVALQWHLGMHGFEEAKRRRDGEAAVCLRQTAP